MPFCEDCDKYYTPTSLSVGGTCPKCGRTLYDDGDERDQKAHLPWHFKLLLVVFAVYLGWRLVQGVEWVVHHV